MRFCSAPFAIPFNRDHFRWIVAKFRHWSSQINDDPRISDLENCPLDRPVRAGLGRSRKPNNAFGHDTHPYLFRDPKRCSELLAVLLSASTPFWFGLEATLPDPCRLQRPVICSSLSGYRAPWTSIL